ncbi:MAG: hypothetical protein O7E54_01800 [Planctomycetota bacterium]|nr:hypothetical protein [Planctomycetota bacterium]
MLAPTVRTAALLAALLGAPAEADVLCTKDGRIFEVPALKHVEGGVEIAFENGTVVVPDDLIEIALADGEPEFVPQTEEEQERFEKGFVPFENKWVTPVRRRGLIKKRLNEQRTIVEEMKLHGNWSDRYTENTKNFQFEFTVPRFVFENYRDKMEAYFQLFAKDWKVKRGRGTGKLNVCFYGNRKEFHRTSGAGRSVLGYFKFVGGYDLNIFYDRLDPGGTEDVMFHEANHYLQKLINEKFRYPHWPGEALAEYYGASDWDAEKHKLTTGLIQEGRLAEIQADIAKDKWLTIRELLTESIYEDYTWGWSLVHFLMNDRRYAKKFKKFFVALANGRDIKRTRGSYSLETVGGEEMLVAFKKYLNLKQDEDFEELEREWHAYVVDSLKLVSAQGLEKAAVKALRTGRDLRAKRLFEEAIAAGTKNANTHHRYAELLLEKKQRDEAIAQWRQAVALDPLTGEYTYALGKALAQDTKTRAEGERVTSLAVEIDPESGD